MAESPDVIEENSGIHHHRRYVLIEISTVGGINNELIFRWPRETSLKLFFALHFCYQWNKNTSFRQGSQPTGVFQVEKSTTSARIRASDPDVETSRFWLFDYPGIIKNGLFSLKPIKPRFNENLRKYWRNKSKHPCILGLITDILYYFTDPSCRVHNFVP